MTTFTELFRYYYKNKLFINGKLEKVPAWTVNKVAVDEFCERHGIPRPNIYKLWDTPDEIDFDGLPDTFVIKPSNLNSSRGVHVLEKLKADLYFDHFNEVKVTLNDVIEAQQTEYTRVKEKESHRLKNYRIMAQERIADKGGNAPVPTDFKFWVVGQSVRFIAQMNERNASKLGVCFYDKDFEPLPPTNEIAIIKEANAVHTEHKIIDPKTRKEMIALAERAAREMGANFIRVDLYLTDDGPKLGELTPVPGTVLNGKYFGFTAQFDTELGALWSAALEIRDESWRA